MIEHNSFIMLMFILLVFTGVWLQKRVSIVQKLSAAMYCIFGGMILANLGIIPTYSGAHDIISAYVLPFSIAIILLNAKIIDLKFVALPALKAYLIHSVVIIFGFLVAAGLLKGLIGPETWQAAAVFIAGGLGGTVNNIVAGNTVGIDPGFFGPVLTAAMVGFTLFLIFIHSAPTWMPKLGFKKEYKTLNKEEAKEFYDNYWSNKSISLDSLTKIISIAAIITIVSLLLKQHVLDIPVEIYVTTLALLVANIGNIGNVDGSEEIATYGFLLFFATIGGMVDIMGLITEGPLLLVMYLIGVAIAILLLFIFGRLLGINYEALSIASNAGVGGPTTAPVMAISFGWDKLVLTGILLGIFGYAIGSYVGIAGGYLIKFLLF